MDLVRHLAQDEWGWLLSSSPRRTCVAGKIIFGPEDCGETLFLLQRGCVHIYRLSRNGRKLVLGEFGAGTVFGLLALVGNGCYGVFAEAVEPCLLCLLPKHAIVRLLQQNPRLAWRLFEATGESLRQSMLQLEDLAFKTVRARLAGTLVALFEQHGPQLERMTHQDLAERVGTSRETASALLNGLRRAGVIALERHHIQVLDVEVLRAIAEPCADLQQHPRSAASRKELVNEQTRR